MTCISCGAIMTALSTLCSFRGSFFGLVEGDDVAEDEAVDIIGTSITLFPFHKMVYVFATLSLCPALFDQKAMDIRK